MVGNPYRWKATIYQLENRNATAGCLLSVLFVIPYMIKWEYNIWIIALFFTFYVGLFVPLITGIMPVKTLVRFLRSVCLNYLTWNKFLKIFVRISDFIKCCHFVYFQLDNVHTTTKQIAFCVAAERYMCPDQKFCSLFVLLFYSVLAYLQRALHARPWAHLLHETSTKEFLKLTTAFIVVRLGKGVAMSLVLITFTLQFNHLEPSISYVAITFLYFLITQFENENIIKQLMERLLKILRLQWMEGLEVDWVPIILSGLSIGLSIMISIFLLFNGLFVSAFILSYTGIFVPIWKTYEALWVPLREQIKIMENFPIALWKNPKIKEGHLCAICLDKMHSFCARVTPCGHVFHGGCLRLCLNYSLYCPLCKTQIVLNR